MTIFAFDVKLFAVVRVDARNEDEARALVTEYVECVDLSEVKVHPAITLTEASADGEPDLFEVDGAFCV